MYDFNQNSKHERMPIFALVPVIIKTNNYEIQ